MDFYLSTPHPCSYFTEREARTVFCEPETLSQKEYALLLSANFRRSGRIVYRPECAQCQRCRQIRVPVDRFLPGASQRRSVRKNQDLVVELTSDLRHPQAVDLYRRFVHERHHSPLPPVEEVHEFLGTSNTDSLVMLYWLHTRLVGAGWLDQVDNGLSSVYFAFDPAEAKRSLGVFSVLQEIATAKNLGLSWYYLGYWVNQASTMDYKADYRPNEILVDGTWLPDEQAFLQCLQRDAAFDAGLSPLHSDP